MSTVRELLVKWGFEVDEGALKKAQASISGLKTSLKVMGATAVSEALAVFGLAEHTAHAGKEAEIMAQRAGLGTQAFQELAFAASKGMVDTEQFAMSMGFLNKHMYEAKTKGGESALAFHQLGGGILAAIKSGADSEQVFMMVAEQIKNTSDQGKKAKLAMELFGRSGRQMLPILNKGAEGIRHYREQANELGLVLDAEAIEKSKELMSVTGELKGNLMGMKNIIGVGLMGPVTDVVKSMNAWIKVNRKMITSTVLSFLEAMGVVIRDSVGFLMHAANFMATFVKALGGASSAIGILVTAFRIFMGLRIAYEIGTAVMALGELVAAFTVAGNSALVAQLKMAAIGVIVGLAVLYVIGLIEDIIGFFTGKDSVTGLIVEAFGKMSTAAQVGMLAIMGPIGWVILAVRSLATLLDYLADKFNIFQKIRSAFPNAIDMLKFGGQAVGSNPFAAPATSSAGGSSISTVGDINASVQVTVPPGTDPTAVGQAVQTGVRESLDDILRPASRALRPGVAY